MRRFVLVAFVALLMIAACVVPARGSAGSVAVEVGDYWKYSATASQQGLYVTGTEKMMVTGTEGSGANEVYVLALSGSGKVSGSVEGNSVSGSVSFSGEVRRLTSNFSLVSQELKEDMKIQMMGESASIVLQTSQTCSPALDDFIGDNDLGHGDVLVSRSEIATTVSMTIKVGGQTMPFSDTMTQDTVVTIRIGPSNESVTVAAGTFDCYVCTYTVAMDTASATMTYYYSATAGNYVKATGSVEGVSIEMGMLGGDGELKAFAFGGKGSGSSMLSGGSLLIIVGVVVVVVALLLVLLVRRRGRNVVTLNAEPPPQVDSPLPPSTGPGPGT